MLKVPKEISDPEKNNNCLYKVINNVENHLTTSSGYVNEEDDKSGKLIWKPLIYCSFLASFLTVLSYCTFGVNYNHKER